jgi:hypothetical protein
MSSASARYVSRLLAAAMACATLATALPAAAAIKDGEAVSICRKKVEQEFGEGVRTTLVRLRTQTSYTVDLKVTGSDKGRFSAKCKVSRDGELESFEHTAK